MGKPIYLGNLRRYTKLQSLYLAGPGSVRPVGLKQVFGISAAAPCRCSGEVSERQRWTVLTHEDLARRLGVQGLVEPAVTEVFEGRRSVDSATILDVWRFPQTEYCTGCGRLQSWGAASGSRVNARLADQLGVCERSKDSGHSRRTQTLQFEFMWVCPQGHLDSISPYCESCGAPRKRAGQGNDFAIPVVCTQCGAADELTIIDEQPCTGLMPHAHQASERVNACPETMGIHRITDPAVWQSKMVTALHLPRHILVSEEQYDCISDAVATRAFDTKTTDEARISYVRDRLLEAGLERDVDDVSIATVMQRAHSPHQPATDADLDAEIRTAEMKGFAQLRSRNVDMPLFIGSRAKAMQSGPFQAVSGIERMRVTTVLVGSGRLGQEGGRNLLWGHQPTSAAANDPGHGWLPAFQSFGEGLLLWLDDSWLGTLPDQSEAAHTCGHVAIRALAKHAGVSVAAVRERIYRDPAPAVLLYVATGDQVGTLGGLASLARDPGWLSEVMTSEVAAQQWCSLDPVCESERGGACHHCLYLPETSCEGVMTDHGLSHNEGLRRASLADWWH